MALAIMVRRSASAALLFTVKHGCGASLSQLCCRFFPSALHFSTEPASVSNPDKRILKHANDRVVKQQNHKATRNILFDDCEDFPFKIEDNAGEQVVKLTRQYKDETIEVKADGVELGKCDKDDADGSITPITLVVRITKDVGPFLELYVGATPDKMRITGLYLVDEKAHQDTTYDGHPFGKLDEKLQNSFYKYLNVRGITTDFTSLMHDYMVNKNNREHGRLLENVKKFGIDLTESDN